MGCRLFLAGLISAALAAPASAADAPLDLSQYRGKVVYLDFWASWCGPCRQSFPFMNALRQKYATQGLAVVAVNVDANRQDANQFLQSTPASFPVVFDSKGSLAEQYNVPGMPTTLLIDRHGKIRDTRIGFRSNEKADYEAEVERLLDEK